jgi:hypothetical protein
MNGAWPLQLFRRFGLVSRTPFGPLAWPLSLPRQVTRTLHTAAWAGVIPQGPRGSCLAKTDQNFRLPVLNGTPPTDSAGMSHRTLSVEPSDVPPPVVTMERRSAPDRRDSWRGGRRDADWFNRPPGSLDRGTRLNGLLLNWRSWLSVW